MASQPALFSSFQAADSNAYSTFLSQPNTCADRLAAINVFRNMADSTKVIFRQLTCYTATEAKAAGKGIFKDVYTKNMAAIMTLFMEEQDNFKELMTLLKQH